MTRRPRDTDVPTVDDNNFRPTGERLDSFYRDLETLLLQQLNDDAKQHAVRLKLLELYFETRRTEDFLKQARTLWAKQGNATTREWQKTISMGMILAPTDPLFRQAQRERVEFVDAAEMPKAPPVRRFGDEARRMRLFEQLAADYQKVRSDPPFLELLDRELIAHARRPSSLMHCKRLSDEIKGAQIFLKREDLSPADTHLTIAVVGTALLARRLGRKTLVTGTTDGRRGVIMASIAARLGLEAVVYMDSDEMHRQSSNVFSLWLMGANLQAVDASTLRNADVREAALEYWGQHPDDALLVLGLDAAPPPYPMMAREFTAAIGRETRRQVMAVTRRPPDVLVSRGGNNADALGFFPPYLTTGCETRLVCVTPKPAASEPAPRRNTGAMDPSRVPMSEQEKRVARSIMEGLEYPAVTREHAWLRSTGRVEDVLYAEDSAKNAIQRLSQREGIIPALESAHALAWALHAAQGMKPEQSIVVMMAEDAQKDLWDIGRKMGVPF
ncbi:MAG TPA: pyridoxal-phosphate dependent enzyme [Candidatus Binatia bacterium]|nr:pyridoxal-phosphate dependent enzyme [Candidatus Binatia bacterium]